MSDEHGPLHFSRKVPRKIKLAANAAVKLSIGAGSLTRGPCEVCGAARAVGHHDDYALPLVVMWLCARHHVARHREMGHRTSYGGIPASEIITDEHREVALLYNQQIGPWVIAGRLGRTPEWARAAVQYLRRRGLIAKDAYSISGKYPWAKGCEPK